MVCSSQTLTPPAQGRQDGLGNSAACVFTSQLYDIRYFSLRSSFFGKCPQCNDNRNSSRCGQPAVRYLAKHPLHRRGKAEGDVRGQGPQLTSRGRCEPPAGSLPPCAQQTQRHPSPASHSDSSKGASAVKGRTRFPLLPLLSPNIRKFCGLRKHEGGSCNATREEWQVAGSQNPVPSLKRKPKSDLSPPPHQYAITLLGRFPQLLTRPVSCPPPGPPASARLGRGALRLLAEPEPRVPRPEPRRRLPARGRGRPPATARNAPRRRTDWPGSAADRVHAPHPDVGAAASSVRAGSRGPAGGRGAARGPELTFVLGHQPLERRPRHLPGNSCAVGLASSALLPPARRQGRFRVAAGAQEPFRDARRVRGAGRGGALSRFVGSTPLPGIRIPVGNSAEDPGAASARRVCVNRLVRPRGLRAAPTAGTGMGDRGQRMETAGRADEGGGGQGWPLAGRMSRCRSDYLLKVHRGRCRGSLAVTRAVQRRRLSGPAAVRARIHAEHIWCPGGYPHTALGLKK